MRCGRCRAEVMLGSAQCGRCGAPLIGGDQVVAQTGSTAPPPPPPPGTPAPPQVASPRQARRAAAGMAGPVPKPKSGCGCIGLVLALVVVGIAVAIFGAVAGSRGFDSVSGEEQDEGPLVIGVRSAGGIGLDDTDIWTLEGTGDSVRIRVFADGFDAVLEVFDDAGQSAGRNDDAVDRDPQLELPLEDGVEYAVHVTGFTDDSGDYEILAETLSVDGGSLVIGVPVSGEIEEGGSVRYRFTGEGRPVRFTVDGDFDSELRVLDGAGAVLVRNDDTNGLDPEVIVDVGGGQSVVVEVFGHLRAAGSYTLVAT